MPMKTVILSDFDHYLFRFNRYWKEPSVWISADEEAEETTPTHQIGVDICPWCLTLIPNPLEYAQHQAKCSPQKPPGILAYDDRKYRFYLIEPRTGYSRNLFRLGRIFFKRMENLYYDNYNADVWNFCVLTISGKENGQNVENLVGFFVKPTKRIALADLIIMPNYRKFGLEQFMIDFSYLLGLLDNNELFVYPDMPIMLRYSFQDYWEWKICNNLFFNPSDLKQQHPVSIEDVKKNTSIAAENIVNTLNGLDQIDRDDHGDVVIKFNTQSIPKPPGPVASRRHLQISEQDYKLWCKIPLLCCPNCPLCGPPSVY